MMREMIGCPRLMPESMSCSLPEYRANNAKVIGSATSLGKEGDLLILIVSRKSGSLPASAWHDSFFLSRTVANRFTS